MSVKVFSTKILIGDTIFYISSWNRDLHFTWSSEPREGLPACSAKGVPSFLSCFKTLSIGPAPLCNQALYRLSQSCRGMSMAPKTQAMRKFPRVEIFENAGLSFTCGWMKTGVSNTMTSYIIYFENILLALRTLCKGCYRVSTVSSF